MNYIEQIKGFWITQEVNQLGTSEIAMYFHLLEIWNKTGWIGCFRRNNYKVMADLSIKSYKTLQSVRDKLKSADIIDFKQRNGDANVEYYMHDLGKYYKGLGKGLGKGSGEGLVEGSGVDNINQTEQNQTSKSHSGGKPPGKKKNKSPEEKTQYWKALVKIWFDFYGENFKDQNQKPAEPVFNSVQGEFLSKIVGHLKKLSDGKNYTWSEPYATKCLRGFFEKAYHHDDWIRKNFELANLLTKFNSITNTSVNGTTINKGNTKKISSAIDYEGAI